MSGATLNVSTLKEVLCKIINEEKPYCSICFRTNDEVRLMTPDYINRFMEATLNELKPIDGPVCYICERKCQQAHTMYRNMIYSNTIRLIVYEAVTQKITHDDIFETSVFKKLLKNARLSVKLRALDILAQLLYIRTNSRLSQTNMVVTDSTQPIQQKHKGDVIKSSNIAPPQTFDSTKLSPICSNIVTNRDGTSTRQHLDTLKILKLSPIRSAETSGNNTASHSHVNKQPETVVIDDEDEQTDNTTNKNTTPVGVLTHLHVLTQIPDPNNIQKVPKIITMEDVQNTLNKDKKFLLHNIFLTDDNKYIVPTLGADIIDGTITFYDTNKKIISKQPLAWEANFLNRNPLPGPGIGQKNKKTIVNNKMAEVDIANIQNRNIFFTNESQSNDYENVTNVSCEKDPLALNDAFDVNSIDTNQNKGLVVVHTGDGVLKRFMMIPEGVSKVNSTISNTNVNQNKMAVGGTNSNKVLQNSNVVSNRKRKNTSVVPILSKPKVTDIIITDINNKPSSSSNKTGTDWEDKIPMDVISFMDAVDPNADEMFKPPKLTPFDSIQISEPVSLATTIPPNRHKDSEIIDLC